VLVCVAFVLAGCDRPPPDSKAREWTAQDHDQADERAKLQSGASSKGRGPKGGDAGADDANLVELTWQKQCALCHGAEGRGDGPQGPMLKAPDLTRAEFQARASDQQIAGIILGGKGLMPKFDLPPEIVRGLIARIRGTGGTQGPAPDSPASTSASAGQRGR
jgi:cytochrome c oxidase cbb3-type subunit 3